MKKETVMKLVSETRAACEQANFHFRSTAYRPRTLEESEAGVVGPLESQPHLLPISEEERKEQITAAYYWTSEARRRSEAATRAALVYAKQNGISIQDIDTYGRKKGWLS